MLIGLGPLVQDGPDIPRMTAGCVLHLMFGQAIDDERIDDEEPSSVGVTSRRWSGERTTKDSFALLPEVFGSVALLPFQRSVGVLSVRQFDRHLVLQAVLQDHSNDLVGKDVL